MGKQGKLEKWIHNFLTEREHYIVVNGTVIKVSHVTSGVPQGTVLGPTILFIMLINDIDNNVQNHVFQFCLLRPVDSESHVENLQAELDTINIGRIQIICNSMVFFRNAH